ncbi:porin [Fluviibacter phosphoraccumulans]|uniref:Membrane protein n=1 Tax=Fluviibacter phosphoraccumulans TaxID=1751046 RepID=A0A7R6TP40_9RHOO|nr:porin [Fluviibacter phosphoraccumulans]BBU67913.1 membrane protein [Fluviibacter phosphoraccumulans]BBU70548.1 membrane protein [Fluviibacter phosphoraccumulans]
MQKKLIALAVAGLSTAAFAQTNVTIYGVADVSAQGYNMTQSNGANAKPAGGSFNMTNNSSLLGFKGTEDLGNGLKGLFQVETNVNLTGGAAGVQANTGNSAFGSLRDTYVGLNSKYGTVMAGYLSTPFRSALNSFDVMPGATGVGRIENMMGTTRFGNAFSNGAPSTGTGYVQGASSVRATALAYAIPTLYGINGSIAYTGSNNNGGSNQVTITEGSNTATNLVPQSALSMNLGWSGYGVDIKGAFQQAKINNTTGVSYSTTAGGTTTTAASNNSYQAYTSYLIGAAYTGVPGLKAAVVYNRNTLGLNANGADSVAAKGSNNQIWAGVSYRFGNNEPRLSYVNSSNTSGFDNSQDGGRQITANWGYYLSKRTQVYGLVSQVKNNANGVWNFGGTGSNLAPTGGQSLLTYGAGMRTNF